MQILSQAIAEKELSFSLKYAGVELPARQITFLAKNMVLALEAQMIRDQLAQQDNERQLATIPY